MVNGQITTYLSGSAGGPALANGVWREETQTLERSNTQTSFKIAFIGFLVLCASLLVAEVKGHVNRTQVFTIQHDRISKTIDFPFTVMHIPDSSRLYSSFLKSLQIDGVVVDGVAVSPKTVELRIYREDEATVAVNSTPFVYGVTTDDLVRLDNGWTLVSRVI